MVRVRQEINVYEVDGKQAEVGHPVMLGIDSCLNRGRCVVLVVHGKRFTVAGAALCTAIKNAMNTG
jgi:hypothetical protein